MWYDPQKHHRRSIRLKGYDYSQKGLYFITLCCQNRACLFGEIKNGQMILNDAGKMAQQYWDEITAHYPNVLLHEYVIMPNHIHGIIEFIATKYDAISVGAKNISPMECLPPIECLPPMACFPPDMNDNDANQTGEKNNGVNSLGADSFGADSFGADSIGADSIGADSFGAKNISPLRSPSQTVGSVIRGFKIGVTKWMRQNSDIRDVWQRNYWEHIIRNQQEYERIANYIINNPAKWEADHLNKPSEI